MWLRGGEAEGGVLQMFLELARVGLIEVGHEHAKAA
jgi:hypothetical protein